GADVDAAGGLADQHQGRPVLQLARHHLLLLVPARERDGAQVGVRRAHVVALHPAPAGGDDAAPIEQGPLAVGRHRLVAEDGILPGGKALHEPHPQAVLGHVAE
ncbi:hypothetical protein RZS08_03415, partial [Arthrospira platensis SPKY1]|nr:hypothetical protein [Arthrospira platensis SPKY1]